VFAYAEDPKWARHLAAVVPWKYTRRDAEEFVAQSVLTSWDTNPIFAIEFDSRVVGGINLRIRQPHETAELGYSIAVPHWGKGLVPEAARAVVDWGFEEYGLAKVYATADLRNVRSHRVMEKLGMVREGVLRSHAKVRGERRDEVVYGLLREEWEAGR
jgi:RimJ/RimL family protein N-acetyltransferase